MVTAAGSPSGITATPILAVVRKAVPIGSEAGSDSASREFVATVFCRAPLCFLTAEAGRRIRSQFLQHIDRVPLIPVRHKGQTRLSRLELRGSDADDRTK